MFKFLVSLIFFFSTTYAVDGFVQKTIQSKIISRVSSIENDLKNCNPTRFKVLYHEYFLKENIKNGDIDDYLAQKLFNCLQLKTKKGNYKRFHKKIKLDILKIEENNIILRASIINTKINIKQPIRFQIDKYARIIFDFSDLSSLITKVGGEL